MLVEWWCQVHPEVAPWLASRDDPSPCPLCGNAEYVIRLMEDFE